MSQDAVAAKMTSLVDRVKAILLTPKLAWATIDLEPYVLPKLLTGYVLILAAIGPICSTIGMSVFGIGGFGFSFRPSITSLVTSGIISYVMSIVSVFILGFVINVIAPSFDGTKNFGQAIKVAAYSATATWVAGIFGLVPALGILGIIGSLYTLYLLYLGLPRLMRSPESKSLGYTAVVIIIAIVIGIVTAAILLPLRMATSGLGMAGLGAAGAAGALSSPGGSLSINGSNVDVAKLSAASAALQASAASMAAAGASGASGASTTHYSPDELKALLPAAVDGMARSEISSESAGAGGIGAAHARAEYAAAAGGHITLELTDLGAMGALGAMAAAVNVNSSKDTATGYEKVSTSGDRVVTENYDRSDRSGKYGILMGGKISVEAEGTGVSIDDLKAAVNAIGLDRLEAAAHRS